VSIARVTRGGTYYRVCDPSWKNAADTSYAKRHGGRWNPPGAFGALYLNRTIAVAAANARRSLAREFGDAVAFADIRPERRPALHAFTVVDHRFVDLVSARGLRAARLPVTFPLGCDHRGCQRLARVLYADGEAGVAVRSAVGQGEELAIFDSHASLAQRKRGKRKSFDRWFPGLA